MFRTESPMEIIRTLSCMFSLGAKKTNDSMDHETFEKSPKICETHVFSRVICVMDFLQPSNQGLCAILGLLCNLELCQTSFLLGPRVSGENRCHIVITYPVKGGKILAAWKTDQLIHRKKNVLRPRILMFY